MYKNYKKFLIELDDKLTEYFARDRDKIKCHKGCSDCCKNANFPLSLLEMKYLMSGFLKLDKEIHDKVRYNIKSAIKQNKDEYNCPFLVNDMCSVYEYRPIICRVYGLAYMRSDGVVSLPCCTPDGKNYSENFSGKTVDFEPLKTDLSPSSIRINDAFGEVRPMIKWFDTEM